MRLPLLLRTASFRLAAAYVALFGISVIALGAIVYFKTTDEFEREARLHIEAEGEALQHEFAEGGLSLLLTAIESRHRSKLSGGLQYVVYDARGTILSGTLAELPYRAGWTNVVGPPDGDEPPGEMERLTVLAVPLSDNLWLAIGDDLIRIETFGAAILNTFIWVALLSATLAILGGVGLSAVFMGRIRAITDTAEAIINGDIQRRVPRRRAADEIDRLAATLNHMLDRIGALMEALRQVSSSIAHELRTPLAHLKQTLECARATGAEGAAGPSIEQAIEEVDAVLSTFSALLRIAQIESGTRRQGFQSVDLSALVESIVQTFTPIAEDGGRALTAAIDPGILVSGDSELLTQLVVNVLENALRHTPLGTPIDVRLTAGAGAQLVIADRGAGIPGHERQNVFQRFHRVETVRNAPGSGLGLSMVAAVAELHGIEVMLDDNAPGLVVRFVFPERRGAWQIEGPVRNVAETVEPLPI
jgi:signal transduction histidine kinase